MIEERHRKAAQKSIQYLHQVTGFLKGESQHLRKLWVESVAQIIADCEASSDPLAVAVRMERAEAEVARLREALRKLLVYDRSIHHQRREKSFRAIVRFRWPRPRWGRTECKWPECNCVVH